MSIEPRCVFVKQLATTTQLNTLLYTATEPVNLAFLNPAQVAVHNYVGATSFGWAIVIVRDGQSIGTLQIDDGDDFYSPVSHLLSYGGGYLYHAGPIAENNPDHGDREDNRLKLWSGDKLYFCSLCSTTVAAYVGGPIFMEFQH